MKTVDQNYFYSLQKILQDFKESASTTSSKEANQLLKFIETKVPFKEEDIVFFEVVEFLAFVREYPIAQITLNTRLKQDLKMGMKDKSFMRVPFNKIIKRLGGTKWVISAECTNCVKVKNCVDLIKSKLS